MFYSWEIEDDMLDEALEIAKKEYIRLKIQVESTEKTYWEVIESVVKRKLKKLDIDESDIIIISFRDEECKCIYNGVKNTSILFTEFTKVGKPCKKRSYTHWTMYKHIKLFKKLKGVK